jgi:hypothetical protein
MKGVSYITDSHKRIKAVLIDIKTIEKYDEQIEDLFDVIIAESRRDEESVPFDKVVKSLKKKGRS